jgi:putative redox protein
MESEETEVEAGAFCTNGVTAHDTGVGKFQVEIHTAGVVILADQPVDSGGLGSGPGPHQLLASGLAACTTMTLQLYARRKGWPLERVRVRVSHVPPVAGGRDRFAREIALDGALDEDQRNRLLEVANRCPVHLTLERGSDIATSLADPTQASLLTNSDASSTPSAAE